jgi:hypothetical protein
MKGIPIGGPISGAVLNAVLSRIEVNFQKFVWPKLSNSFGLDGPLHDFVTFGRYVDDVVAVSRWLCPRCTERLVNRIYKGQVTFDASNEGLRDFGEFRCLRFLDVWLFLTWSTFEATLAVKNDLFALSALTPLLVKNRFPLPVGPFNSLWLRIGADFKGRCARM